MIKQVHSGFVITLLIMMTGISGCVHHQKRSTEDLLSYGVRLAQKGYWHEAAIRWRKVAELDPGNIAAWNNLAIAAEAEGYPDRAKQLYDKALALDPGARYILKNIEALKQRSIDETTRATGKEKSYDSYKKSSRTQDN